MLCKDIFGGKLHDRKLNVQMHCIWDNLINNSMGPSLLQDNGVDIKAMPEFMHLSKDGVSMSGLVFNIIVENAI